MNEGLSNFEPSKESGPFKESTALSIAQAMAKRDDIEVEKNKFLISDLTEGADPHVLEVQKSLQSSLKVSMYEFSLLHPEMSDFEIKNDPQIKLMLYAEVKKASKLLIPEDLDAEEIAELDSIIESSLGMGLRAVLVEGNEITDIQKNTPYERYKIATEIANEKGLIVEEVFMYDDYFLELRRKEMTPEEALEYASKKVDSLRNQFLPLINNMIRGMLGGMVLAMEDVNSNVAEEAFEEFDKDFTEVNELLKNLLHPIALNIKRDLETVWGKDLAA